MILFFIFLSISFQFLFFLFYLASYILHQYISCCLLPVLMYWASIPLSEPPSSIPRLLLYPENEGSSILQNVADDLSDSTASHASW
jgi:hypothetical protein